MASINPANEPTASDEYCVCGHSYRDHDPFLEHNPDDQACEVAGCGCQAFEAENPYEDEDRWYPGHPEDQDAYGSGPFDRDHPRLY